MWLGPEHYILAGGLAGTTETVLNADAAAAGDAHCSQIVNCPFEVVKVARCAREMSPSLTSASPPKVRMQAKENVGK